jgi:hypothetical protein
MMKQSALHKVSLLLLTAALIFGQVGAGFFHNKHNAHEAITDLDHTVLVNHGEHCKICSVDWVHQFLSEDFSFQFLEEQPISFVATDILPVADSIILSENGRAPPYSA